MGGLSPIFLGGDTVLCSASVLGVLFQVKLNLAIVNLESFVKSHSIFNNDLTCILVKLTFLKQEAYRNAKGCIDAGLPTSLLQLFKCHPLTSVSILENLWNFVISKIHHGYFCNF